MSIHQHSVFRSSLRTFCTSFATVLGVIAGIFILVFIGMFLSPPSYLREKPELYLAPDAQGNRDLLGLSAPAILRIDINGVIGTGDLTSQKFDEILMGSREDLLSHNRVKGILLYINTPGGVVTDADDIYRSLMAYKKKYNIPIYSYVDGMCASGGMYIASASDKIFATPSSVIGSVGVILGPTFNFSQAMDKVGIKSLTITQGKDKDMLNPFRPWREGEADSIKAVTAALYTRFVDIVTESRKNLSKEKLVNEYGANIFVSSTAQSLGYIDNGNSDYTAALEALTAAAGIKEKEAYQVVTLQIHHPFFSQLTQGKLPLLNGQMTHSLQLSPLLSPELSGKFLYLYDPTTF